MLESLRDSWEGRSPRERRLLTALGATAVIVLAVWVFLFVTSGLDEIAARNQATRDALAALAAHNPAADKTPKGPVIGDESPSLATYLEAIEGEVGVQIKNTSEKPPLTKGKFHEKALTGALYGISTGELAQFLRLVETRSPIVVTQRLNVTRSTSTPERLDRVDFTVVTYERAKAKGEKDKDKADAGSPAPAEAEKKP